MHFGSSERQDFSDTAFQHPLCSKNRKLVFLEKSSELLNLIGPGTTTPKIPLDPVYGCCQILSTKPRNYVILAEIKTAFYDSTKEKKKRTKKRPKTANQKRPTKTPKPRASMSPAMPPAPGKTVRSVSRRAHLRAPAALCGAALPPERARVCVGDVFCFTEPGRRNFFFK